MKQKKFVVGFIGAGGIARAHVFSLNSVHYYYDSSPEIELEAVCSATGTHRESFAGKYRFNRALPLDGFLNNKEIDTVFILGPNVVHYQHLKAVLNMPGVKRIYLEKPVCSTVEEEISITGIVKDRPEIIIQVGFQYLFSTHIREALILWKSGMIGKPIHFDVKYFHGDYLQESYRSKRNRSRPRRWCHG
jgi:predicted dehydrogenase